VDVTADIRANIERAGNSRISLFRIYEAVAVVGSDSPDLDQAVSLARDSLRTATRFQATPISSNIATFLTAAAPHNDHPAIRELADEAHTWRESRSVSARTVEPADLHQQQRSKVIDTTHPNHPRCGTRNHVPHGDEASADDGTGVT
jgi:hypothetical protein